MFWRNLSPDSVAVTGSVIGILSLPFSWLTIKSSRIAAGTGLNLWDSGSWYFVALLVCLWLFCLAVSLLGKRKAHSILLGIAANSILIITFWYAGYTASNLLVDEAVAMRISLGAGVWISIVAAYILIFASRQKLDNMPAARHLVSFTGLAAIVILLSVGWLDGISIMQEFYGRETRFQQELLQHIFLFGGSVATGTVIGIPLGIWASRSGRAEKPIFFITNIMQTIPSLALFGLLIAPLSALSFAFPALREFGIRGVGATPAMIALIIYSLLPIVRNTYVSLNQIDPAVLDAGFGMGMSRSKVFRKIEVPLAAPLVLEGVRTASVQSVGNTAVAALIGAGGLGWFIFQGLGQAAADIIILGAIPIIALALVVDFVMRSAVRLSTPKGITGGS